MATCVGRWLHMLNEGHTGGYDVLSNRLRTIGMALAATGIR